LARFAARPNSEGVNLPSNGKPATKASRVVELPWWRHTDNKHSSSKSVSEISIAIKRHLN
jgi:hypothetical protein